MKILLNSFKGFSSRYFSVMQHSNKNMEDVIKNIFYASVNSVKPSELITKNKLRRFYDESNREFVVIKQKSGTKKFEVTNKKIHLGKY